MRKIACGVSPRLRKTLILQLTDIRDEVIENLAKSFEVLAYPFD